jgi:hypothetical protein
LESKGESDPPCGRSAARGPQNYLQQVEDCGITDPFRDTRQQYVMLDMVKVRVEVEIDHPRVPEENRFCNIGHGLVRRVQPSSQVLHRNGRHYQVVRASPRT